MTRPALSTVPAGDAPNVLATIVSAFARDPVERWLWPQEGQYLAHFPRFVEAFGGPAYAQQTVWTLGGFSAVALWLAPASEPDGEAIVEVLNETASPDKHDDTFAVLEQIGGGPPRCSALVSAVARRSSTGARVEDWAASCSGGV